MAALGLIAVCCRRSVRVSVCEGLIAVCCRAGVVRVSVRDWTAPRAPAFLPRVPGYEISLSIPIVQISPCTVYWIKLIMVLVVTFDPGWRWLDMVLSADWLLLCRV